MSPPHSPTQVSLPSINELFPEHLLTNPPQTPKTYSPSSLKSSLNLRYADEAQHSNSVSASRVTALPSAGCRPYRVSAERSPTEFTRPKSLQTYATPPPAMSSADTHDRYHDTGPHMRREFAAPAAPYSISVASVQVAAHYSFDVLRPNPLTAGLENVASSTNAAEPPRVSHVGSFAYGGASADSMMASVTRARPAFRVQLPAPSMAADAARHRPFGGYENMEPEGRMAAFPPSVSANAYLSVPTTPGSAQSLQRISQQPELVPGSEEKRHRCPHCSKRFNRPSSLNIHVNTHTGAKPFVCRFPGCNRRFNVNSNMRRHYRNHLTSRRRDVVARLLPQSSPSPSMSVSPSASPEPPYMLSYPHPSTSYTVHSPHHYAISYSGDDRVVRPYSRDSSASGLKYESAPEPDLGMPESNVREDRCRLRSNSSPIPRYREERLRPRASSCIHPGCRCTSPPISTALRPAFPEYMPPQSRNAERPGRP